MWLPPFVRRTVKWENVAWLFACLIVERPGTPLADSGLTLSSARGQPIPRAGPDGRVMVLVVAAFFIHSFNQLSHQRDICIVSVGSVGTLAYDAGADIPLLTSQRQSTDCHIIFLSFRTVYYCLYTSSFLAARVGVTIYTYSTYVSLGLAKHLIKTKCRCFIIGTVNIP